MNVESEKGRIRERSAVHRGRETLKEFIWTPQYMMALYIVTK